MTLHLEKLWCKHVTLRTGIPWVTSIPALMRAIAAGSLDVNRLITHRLALGNILEGYELFRNAGETGALKVISTA